MCASGENGRFAATVASGGFLFAAVRLRLLLPLCFYIKRLFVYACTLSLFNVFFVTFFACFMAVSVRT